jgi:hypothetical protein
MLRVGAWCIAICQYSISYDRLGNDGHVSVVRALKLGLIKIETCAWIDESLCPQFLGQVGQEPKTQRRDHTEDL